MQKNLVPKDEYTRDPNSGALLCTNTTELEVYKARIAKRQKDKKEISKMSDDINSLKEEFLEIKDLLLQVSNSLQQKNDG